MIYEYFKKLKRRFYLESVLAIIVFVYLLNSVIYFRGYFLFHIALAAIFFVAEYVVVRKTDKIVNSIDLSDVPDDDPFFEDCFDRYGRRLINWILIAFLKLFGFLITTISMGINSKLSELLESFNGNLLSLEMVAFFLIKNLLIMRWLFCVHDYTNRPKLRDLLKKILIAAAIYWIVMTAVYWAFEDIFVLNMSNGFMILIPSIITGIGYIASAVFLSIALKQLPLGTAYAMWTGMGIVGTTLLGIFLFHEKLTIPQAICVILIVVGIAGLKILAKE